MPAAIPGRIATQLRVDSDIHEKAAIIARREKRPLNSQYEYWITKGVEQYEAENGTVSIPSQTK